VLTVDYLILADWAEIVGGKSYIQGGGWDRLNVANGFPHQRSIGIAVGIEVPWDATNRRYPLSIKVVNEDTRQDLFGADGVIEAGRPPGIPAGSAQLVQLALNGIGNFESTGEFTVLVAIDGEPVRRRPFRVVDASLPPMSRSQPRHEGPP
jgi:hypothetical protein